MLNLNTNRWLSSSWISCSRSNAIRKWLNNGLYHVAFEASFNPPVPICVSCAQPRDSSLKTELINHLSNINVEYPGGGSPAVVHKAKPPQKILATPAPRRRSQDQFFKNRDRNGDGAITLEEFIGNPKDRNVRALTKRFEKIDFNGDGQLQLDELKKQTK